MNIPNLVYKSPDVGTPYFSTIFYYKFRDRDDAGACCNIAIGASGNTQIIRKL